MERKGKWSETFKVNAFMVNMHREMTLTSICNIFQEVAGNHAVYRKVGFFDMQQRGMFWVLNKLKINMLQFPKWQENILVRTWVRQMLPFSHRHFEVSDGNGNIYGYGYAIWIPIDAITHKPKRFSNFDVLLVDEMTPCEMPQKLSNIESYDSSLKKIIDYSDIDMLGHVNNVKYIEWILNDFYKKNPYSKLCKTLEINYLGEVYQNDEIIIYTKNNNQKTYYFMQNSLDEKEVCRAVLEHS